MTRFSSLVEMLAARAERTPERRVIGYLDGDRVEAATYADVDGRARRVATALRRAGIARADRVGLLVVPGIDYVSAFFGCLYAGAVAVPAYPPWTGRGHARIAHVLADCGASAVVANAAFDVAALREALPAGTRLLRVEDAVEDDRREPDRAGGDDVAFLQYTSGSTTNPKGVVLRHAAVLENLAQIERAFGHDETTVGVNWLPPYHDMGLVGTVLQAFYVGCTSYLLSPLAFVQRPLRWLEAIGRFGATTAGGPSFALDLCCARVRQDDLDRLDLSSLRVFFCGAEPIRPGSVRRFFEAFGRCGLSPRAFVPCYGLAEATLMVTGQATGEGLRTRPHPATGRPLVCCGRPVAGTRVCIVDPETRAALPDGAVGEIWVSSPSVASGYFGAPEATRTAFGAERSDAPGERWLRTGDLGSMHEGQVFPCGRIKDVLIVDGRKIAAEDIEHSAALVLGECIELYAIAALGRDGDDGAEQAVLVFEGAARGGEPLEAFTLERQAEAARARIAYDLGVTLAEAHWLRRGDLLRTSSGKIERAGSRRALLERRIRPLWSWRQGGGSHEGAPRARTDDA
jgi:acyl-CoA synthetase (AMP-forming)/AMP-acid ligase II